MTAYHEHVCLVLAQRSRGVLTHLHSLDRKVISKRRNFSSKVLKVHTAPLPHYPNRNVFSDRWNLLHDRTIALPICCTIIYCTHSFALSESGFTYVVYLLAMTCSQMLIFVDDLNDNSPMIRVNALTEAGEAEIDENLPSGSFVAHVSVTDLDTGSGGQVAA